MTWLVLGIALASARDVGGITFPDEATVGGNVLPLNGVGIRERFFIDIYAAGLYLPTHTEDAAKAIDADVPKRIEMRFLYRHVTREQAVQALQWRLVESPAAASIQDQVERFVGWLRDFDRGDQILFDYVPGKGTTVTLQGEEKGTMPGADSCAPYGESSWASSRSPSSSSAECLESRCQVSGLRSQVAKSGLVFRPPFNASPSLRPET